MASENNQRYQIIKGTFTHRPEAVPDLTLRLWERLAYELTSIIGEQGFQSLYSRSIHRNIAAFPWLALRTEHQKLPQPKTSQFSDLAFSLEGRDPAEAIKASIALLITFTDILATLIGEPLTSKILHSAWGESPFEPAEKDINNE